MVVCVHFKESLPVKCLSNSYLKECLVLEVSINNKRGYVVSLYRSPSQTPDEFDSFITNLEKIVVDISRSNPHFLLLIGDFNARSSNWSSNDTTTAEGAQLDYFTSLYGMKQVITEPTHILESSASCIDLIFTNQPNIVMDSGVHLSLHEKCHHQIIYSKLNLRIEYPPPYIRKIWDYNRSETDSVNRSIEIFDWPSLFSGKNVHEQVELFNKTLLNIFHNFIPNKIILCDDKDPPWMNGEIENLIKRKNWLFQCQRKSSNLDYASLNSITKDISNAVNSSKLKYHERLAFNLNDPKTAPKTYWKILKTFVNGTKIPLIPPLLVGNQLVTNFLVKANLFNDYFSQQCMTVDNDSSIPPNITFATEQKLSTLKFCTDDIVKIIKSLDPNKAHGHDEISIRMIKLCATPISKPLSILFRNCFENQCFPNEWKKANIVPVHKKMINN